MKTIIAETSTQDDGEIIISPATEVPPGHKMTYANGKFYVIPINSEWNV